VRARHRRSWLVSVTLITVALLVPTILVVILLESAGYIVPNVQPRSTSLPCPPSPFISALGSTLCADGRPLRLIGYNWHWIGTGCSPPTDATIESTFAEIKRLSKANVVRTAFYQSGSNGGSYADFGRYIAAAKRHNLYIIPMLANHWTNCEPSDAPKTASWYRDGYTLPGDGYPLAFRDYVRGVAAFYANEPTIAFWQLVNEPDAAEKGCGASAAQILRAFADDMTSVIKAHDRHHLVDLGVPGRCAAGNPADYRAVVSGLLDVADVWHDYGNVTVAMAPMMQERLEVLHALHRPAYIGESGICADVAANGTCTGIVSPESLAQRASFFDRKLSAGFQAGICGYMVWNKGTHSSQNDIGQGDPTENAIAKYALGTSSEP
jgi:hypothetical protein